MLGLASIVEGQGEVKALPIDLSRLLNEMEERHVFKILEPIRRGRHKLLKPGELENAVDLASRKIARSGAILVILDSDDDHPREPGPKLLGRAQSVASEIPTRVVLAHREWEAWFIAAIASISGKRDFLPNLTPPNDPEGRRDAKGWLAANTTTKRYKPTVDQAPLAAIFDLDAARQAPSFSKLCRDLRYLRDETLRKFSHEI